MRNYTAINALCVQFGNRVAAIPYLKHKKSVVKYYIKKKKK